MEQVKEKEVSRRFELVMCVRDKYGNKLNTKRSKSSDESSDILKFYHRMNPKILKAKPKKRTNKNGKKEVIPSEEQAKSILDKLNSKRRQERTQKKLRLDTDDK